ncbi:MAG: carboxypeptidase-like regulatory domain-containing protein [Thermoguttaceae bacterium]
MKTHIKIVLVIAFLLLPTFIGCGPKVPADMPKLYPCTVVITQDNQPLEGAVVTLFHQDPSLQKWTAGGLTDVSGKVVLKTQGRYDGVAEGDYKVTVTKTEVEPGILLNAETEEAIPGKTWTLVEPTYGNVAFTTLKLNVPKKKVSETFDVGSAIKEEMRSN